MAAFSIPNISITGIVASVPSDMEDNMDLAMLHQQEKEYLIHKIGIKTRRIAPTGMSSVDLCVGAALALFQKSQCDPSSIGIVVFVTQTPDYPLPGNSMIVQKKLRLPETALFYDLHQGCSGYVYGLSMIAGLMHSLDINKGLLLVGDTLSHLLSPNDRTTKPIFSDAGSATLLEKSPDTQPMHFSLGADGTGANIIQVRGGGARHPFDLNSLSLKEYSPGIHRAAVHLTMEGIDVMNYSLRHVVPNIQSLLQVAGWDSESIDFFVFHQANKILNESLRKRLDLPVHKVPETLTSFGNTSCATIPITITNCLGEQVKKRALKLLLCGFGAGFSWGSALLETKQGIACPKPIEISMPYGE